MLVAFESFQTLRLRRYPRLRFASALTCFASWPSAVPALASSPSSFAVAAEDKRGAPSLTAKSLNSTFASVLPMLPEPTPVARPNNPPSDFAADIFITVKSV